MEKAISACTVTSLERERERELRLTGKMCSAKWYYIASLRNTFKVKSPVSAAKSMFSFIQNSECECFMLGVACIIQKQNEKVLEG